RTYRTIWSCGSNACRSTRLAARHRASIGKSNGLFHRPPRPPRARVGPHRSARTGRVAGDGQPARLELLGGIERTVFPLAGSKATCLSPAANQPCGPSYGLPCTLSPPEKGPYSRRFSAADRIILPPESR